MKNVLILSMGLAVSAGCKGSVPQTEYVPPVAPSRLPQPNPIALGLVR